MVQVKVESEKLNFNCITYRNSRQYPIWCKTALAYAKGIGGLREFSENIYKWTIDQELMDAAA